MDQPISCRSDQRSETPLTTANVRHAQVSYLYARSRDSQVSDTEGQDYLAWQWQDNRIVFVVCDGVGQSFCGQLAARFLGDELLDWLVGVDRELTADALAAGATIFLTDLVGPVSAHIHSHRLPDDMPPLLHAALEGQRSYGSESMFIAGCLEFASHPNAEGRVLLCWLGDTRVQVFDRDGRPLDIGARWETKERWSSMHGVRGASQIHAWTGGLDRISRVLAYSDGLAGVADRLPELVDESEMLAAEVENSFQSPTSDDISLVNVSLHDIAIPTLQRTDQRWPDLGCRLTWQADADEDTYVLEKSTTRDFACVQQTWVTSATFHVVPEAEMDGTYYRVYAWRDGVRSRASGVVRASVRPSAAGARLVIPVFILLSWLLVIIKILHR